MNKNPKSREELIRQVRQKAEYVLKLWDEAEQGKISAEEFEKRLSKSNVGGVGSGAPGHGFSIPDTGNF